jgi:hypothetical protein
VIKVIPPISNTILSYRSQTKIYQHPAFLTNTDQGREFLPFYHASTDVKIQIIKNGTHTVNYNKPVVGKCAIKETKYFSVKRTEDQYFFQYLFIE